MMDGILREFENFATGTLDQFEKKTNDISFAILLRTNDRFNMSPVEMAIEFNNEKFISNSLVQHLIEIYWYGHDYSKASWRFTRVFIDNLSFGLLHKYLKPKENREKFVIFYLIIKLLSIKSFYLLSL